MSQVRSLCCWALTCQENFNVFSITTWSLNHFLSDMVLFLAHRYFHYIWHHWDRFFVKITRISTPLAAVRNWYSGLIVLHGKEVMHFVFFHLRKTEKIGPILSMKDAEACLCLPLEDPGYIVALSSHWLVNPSKPVGKGQKPPFFTSFMCLKHLLLPFMYEWRQNKLIDEKNNFDFVTNNFSNDYISVSQQQVHIICLF